MHKLVCAIDCGLAMNPDQVAADHNEMPVVDMHILDSGEAPEGVL